CTFCFLSLLVNARRLSALYPLSYTTLFRSDGSHGPVFGPGTAEALALIGEENARIAADPQGRDVVTVAYLVPIPPPGVEDDYDVRLGADVMGAAVAQRQANRTTTLGDRPLIRLLIDRKSTRLNS